MAGRTDRAERIVAASRSRIWRALTEPGELVLWLPPEGMDGRFEAFDLQPGGGYRMILSYRDPAEAGKAGGGEDIVEGRFVELVADELLVQQVEFEADDPAFAGTMTMRWALSDADDGTRVTIRADDVPPGISVEDHQAGMASSLAKLAGLVEA